MLILIVFFVLLYVTSVQRRLYILEKEVKSLKAAKVFEETESGMNS